MPKTIQTGETITLSDLRVEEVTFSWLVGARPAARRTSVVLS